MEQRQPYLRLGAAVILCACLLRLYGNGVFPPVSKWLTPKLQAFLIYLETGRTVRFPASSETVPVFAGESPPPQLPSEVTEPVLPVFSQEQGEALSVRSSSGVSPELGRLLAQPLSWDLTRDGPKVLIYHTHATESYTKTDEVYTETSAYRTLEEDYNMVSVGAHLAQRLQEAGIGVIHDRTLHDYPSYNGSYAASRRTVEDHLKENPGIQLILDLHRDASGDIENQLRPVAEINGQTGAQLMLVIGSGNGSNHPHWEENLSLALKLQAMLERLYPGICRPLDLRSGRFNQDLSTGTVLVEVGAAGNSHGEALLAADALADAIIALAGGTKPE